MCQAKPHDVRFMSTSLAFYGGFSVHGIADA